MPTIAIASAGGMGGGGVRGSDGDHVQPAEPSTDTAWWRSAMVQVGRGAPRPGRSCTSPARAAPTRCVGRDAPRSVGLAVPAGAASTPFDATAGGRC